MGRLATSTEDIEITPRMVEAGCRVFADYDARLESPGRVVTEIFQAMRREEEAQNPKAPVRDRGFRPLTSWGSCVWVVEPRRSTRLN